MTAEALTLKTDERALVKATHQQTFELASSSASPFIYGYDEAAAFLRAIGGPYKTVQSLKSICSKIRKERRTVKNFPVPPEENPTIFDRRRLTAFVNWRKKLGPEPSVVYAAIDVEEARAEIEMREIEAEKRRELKELLTVLAATENDATNRLTDAQIRVLVRRFKELLFEYGWDYASNSRVEM